MENLTQSLGVVIADVTPAPLEGYKVVVLQQTKGGTTLKAILNSSDKSLSTTAGWFTPESSYRCLAVKSDINLSFSFNFRMTLARRNKYFTLKGTLYYHVVDSGLIALKFHTDPLSRLQEEIRERLQRNILESKITIDYIQTNFYDAQKKILPNATERQLRDFASMYGLVIKEITMTYEVPDRTSRFRIGSIKRVKNGEKIGTVGFALGKIRNYIQGVEETKKLGNQKRRAKKASQYLAVVFSSGDSIDDEKSLDKSDVTIGDNARNVVVGKNIAINSCEEDIEVNQKELGIGRILYNPPEEMRVGVKERVEVRISWDLEDNLTKGLKGRGVPKIEKIDVSRVMKTELSGDDFQIKPLSEGEQPIESKGYTQWEWNVTPLKPGNKTLHLRISVIIILDQYGRETKSLPVMDREIKVKVNLIYGIKKNWKWIVGTVIALIGTIAALLSLLKN